MRARPGKRFTFRLAAHLGYTHGELLARMSSREVTEWQVFERLEGPLGQARADVHTAMLCAAVHNAACDKQSQTKPPADFLPQWDRDEQSPEEMLEAVKSLNHRYGGTQIGAAEPAAE